MQEVQNSVFVENEIFQVEELSHVGALLLEAV
jgi:hypothetical protein